MLSSRSWSILTLLCCFLGFSPAFGDAGITYHGRLLKPNGQPVTETSVQFLIQIRTPSPSSCLMYQETQVKDLSQSQGVFSITINDGTQTQFNTEPFNLEETFRNHGSNYVFPAGKCSGGNTVSFLSTLSRQISVSFNDGTFSGWEPLPSQTINFVPSALETVSIGGRTIENLFRVEVGGVPQSLSAWSLTNYQKLLDLVANTTITGGNASIGGNAAGFTGSLAGDVTGGQAATKVERLQGRSVLDSAPSNGQVLTWNNAQTRWEAMSLPAAGAPAWSDITGKPTEFAPGGSAGGDLTGTYPDPTIATSAVNSLKIADGSVAPIDLSTTGAVGGSVLRFDSGWSFSKLQYTDLVNNIGASPWPGTCAAGSFMNWNSGTDSFECVALTNAMVVGAITTLPVNKGGTGATTEQGARNNLLPAQSGNGGKILQTDGTNVSWVDTPSTGITSINGATGTSQTFQTAQGSTSPTFTRVGNIHTLEIPLASTNGVSSGTISYTDYQNFSGKQSALGFTPLNPANNLSELTNTTTARTNLGLGTAATKSYGTTSGDLVELGVGGKIPAALLPDQSGIYFAQGGNDFSAPAVLGTTDAQPLHLQTGGLTKMTVLNNGNVGVGTITPQTVLDVNGEIRAGNIGTACSASSAGAIRYNAAVPQMEFCNGTAWGPMGNGLSQRQSFTTPGVFSFTVPAGVSQIRAYVAGAGGGGSSSLPSAGLKGGDTTFGTVTAFGGYGGNNGSAPGGSSGADVSINGGGAYGGTGAQWDGGWGGLGIKTFSVTPGQVITGSVGAAGGGAPNGASSGTSGAHGYVILEYSGGTTTASSGSGTMNYVPVWTGTTALGSSSIAISGGNVGIGTATPSEALEVVGNIKGTQLCLGTDCRATWPTGAAGTVTSIATGGGLTGGPITDNGTISIVDGGVTGTKLETISGLSAGAYGSATEIPAITVDTKGRITAISTNTVSALPTPSGVSGKFLRSDGTSWSGQNIQFSDVKNSLGGSAFNLASCGPSKTVAWSSLTDTFSCQDINNLDAGKITTGTLDAARLPSSIANGLWAESSGNVSRSSGSVAIGTATPNASALLDLTSSTKGFLPPRMTTAQRNGLASPAAGLLVYDSTENKLYVFNGTKWAAASDSASGVFQVKRSGAMSIPGGGVYQRLTFNAETVDADNAFNPATGLFTAPQDGFYQFSVSTSWDFAPTIGVGVQIFVVDTFALIGYSFDLGNGGNLYQSASGGLYLLAGQRVGVDVWQWNGSAINITRADFSGFRVGAGSNGGSGGVPDNMGNHTATQNLNLGNNQLVGNGGSSGLAITNAGNVGIGTTTPTNKLEVVGGTTKLEQEPWVYPSSLSASWVNYGAGYASFGYRKDSMGYLRLRGIIKDGVASSAFFTLPVGYRPLFSMEFAVSAANAGSPGTANVIIHPDGSVTIETMSTNSWISFDNVSLPLD